MDHYEVLGLGKNASKDEIKEAFRRLAVKFHPDKHCGSPKAVRDSATLRFKQVSAAYEVLSDDRRRADYNFRSRFRTQNSGANYGNNYGYGYGYQNYGSEYRAGSGSATGSHGFVSGFENVLRFLTTRAFLLNAAFAGALLGGMFVIDIGREALWKMHNSGKSFEETMESIEKTKAHKDKM
ncbi:Terminal organelle assembly protein [Trema orientale]|uniref:Terminal organelle assembly protein n=1 Tax=Trema orientale TaxID=63057 RepID=A0A2P5EZU1_TREOI|nr:Terminal organelle assembly protein [Trema orientale]